MSLDFGIVGFGVDKRVVLKDSITLEERQVMSYRLEGEEEILVVS